MGDISTFGMFGVAKLGIYAAQKAMEVTGNNITNINTEGYTRQKVDQISMFMGANDRYSSGWDTRVGNGAMVKKISQIRDPYLDIRYRTTMADVGSAEEMLDGLDQLATIFDEVGKGQGDGVIELQMNDLISQIQRLVTEGAGKDDYDTLVRGSASSLVSLFNTYADNLETLKNNQIDSFEKDLDTVNTLLTKIQELNISIRKSEIHGGQSLELKDLRNNYIDELSKYARISVTYENEDVGGGVMVDKLVIKLEGDDPKSPSKQQVLVNGNYVTQFSWDKKNMVDADGNPLVGADGKPMVDDAGQPLPDTAYNDLFNVRLAELKDQNGRVLELSREDDGTINYSQAVVLGDNDLYGSLQSARELLTEEGEYACPEDLAADARATVKRGIPYYQNMLDALANKFATVLNEANTLPEQTLYMTNPADGTPPNAILDKDGNALTMKLKKADGTLQTLPDGSEIPVRFGLATEKDSEGRSLEGKLVWEEPQADGTKKLHTASVDEIKFTYMNGAGQEVESQPERDKMYSHYNGGPLFSNNGNTNDTDGITAANISIANAWSTGEVRVLCNRGPVDPARPESTNNSNLDHILYLIQESYQDYRPGDIPQGADAVSKDTAFFTGTFQGMLTEISSTLANDTRVVTNRLQNHVSAANDLYMDRDSVSGVDLNDEAMAMMQYNKAYSASCRLLTTLDEMLDKLINGTAL